MKMKLIAVAIIWALAASTQALAQTTPSVQDLQQALAQAQKAAADAQKAAQQAMQALEQIQKATAEAKAAHATQTAGGKLIQPAGEGLVYKSGGEMIRLYGLIDLSGSRKSNADTKGNSLTDMSVAWFSGNRWGIEGEHALADTDGLKAIFKLESEYELPTGNMDTPGTLFNRDAWLGMQSPTLGKLTFGRQNTLGREFSKNYGDPYGSASVTLDEGGWTNNNNFKQLIFYAGSPTSTRYDRGIVWKKDFGGLVLGAAYQLGSTGGASGSPADPANPSYGTSKAIGVAYNGEAFNVAGFYNTANVNSFKDTSYSLGGNYKFGMVRLNAGYFHYAAAQSVRFGDRSDKAYTVSAILSPSTKFDFQLGWQTMNANNAVISSPTGFVPNAFAPFSLAASATTATGKRRTWYGSAFYHYDKRTELYLALDHLTTDGTYRASQAKGFMSQDEYAVGMRFKF